MKAYRFHFAMNEKFAKRNAMIKALRKAGLDRQTVADLCGIGVNRVSEISNYTDPFQTTPL